MMPSASTARHVETGGRGVVHSAAPGPHAPVASSPGPISPVRKAAILLVSLEQSLASQMLAGLDRASVEAVTWEIARLDRIDPDEQAAVLDEFLRLGRRRLCFGFEDLVRMDDRDIRGAFHLEDLGTWALALAGAAPPVRTRVLAALDPQSAATLGRYLEGMGPFRLSEAEAAQSEVAERFRRLYDEGAISLPEPSGRDEVVV